MPKNTLDQDNDTMKVDYGTAVWLKEQIESPANPNQKLKDALNKHKADASDQFKSIDTSID